MLDNAAYTLYVESVQKGINVTLPQIRDMCSQEHAKLVKNGFLDLLWDEDHGMMGVLTDKGARLHDQFREQGLL